MKLWEIGNELVGIAEMIADAGGEITPDTEARLEAVEGAFDEKVERIALLVQDLRGDGAKAKAEKDRLATIQKHYESAADGLTGYLLAQMRRTDVQKIETPRARVRVQKNGVPSIIWTKSSEELPEEYRRVSIAPDLARVRDQLKAGDTPPEGFRVEYGYHVRIF